MYHPHVKLCHHGGKRTGPVYGPSLGFTVDTPGGSLVLELSRVQGVVRLLCSAPLWAFHCWQPSLASIPKGRIAFPPGHHLVSLPQPYPGCSLRFAPWACLPLNGRLSPWARCWTLLWACRSQQQLPAAAPWVPWCHLDVSEPKGFIHVCVKARVGHY